jgi:hypothetical protein
VLNEKTGATAVLKKIISGGQTGADSAALDFAIWHDIPHGGLPPFFEQGFQSGNALAFF